MMSLHVRDVTKITGIGSLLHSTHTSKYYVRSEGKPLVLFFAWLGASENAVASYTQLYLSKGADVLVIDGKVLDFLYPSCGLALAKRVLHYILYEQKEYGRFLAHSLSIGCFNFTLCAKLAKDQWELYGSFRDKLQGMVMDSAVLGDVSRMANGISKITSNSAIVRWTSFRAVMIFFWLSPSTVQFYKDAIKEIKSPPFDKPSLFFICEDDPLCDYQEMKELLANWKSSLMSPVIIRIWEKSIHTAHLKSHREEYLQSFEQFCIAMPTFFNPISKL